MTCCANLWQPASVSRSYAFQLGKAGALPPHLHVGSTLSSISGVVSLGLGRLPDLRKEEFTVPQVLICERDCTKCPASPPPAPQLSPLPPHPLKECCCQIRPPCHGQICPEVSARHDSRNNARIQSCSLTIIPQHEAGWVMHGSQKLSRTSVLTTSVEQDADSALAPLLVGLVPKYKSHPGRLPAQLRGYLDAVGRAAGPGLRDGLRQMPVVAAAFVVKPAACARPAAQAAAVLLRDPAALLPGARLPTGALSEAQRPVDDGFDGSL